MLDLSFVRENLDRVCEAAARKHTKVDPERFRAIDEKRRSLLKDSEALKAKRNEASAAIGAAKKKGEDATQAIKEMREVSGQITEMDARLREAEQESRDFLLGVPNLTHESVPVGNDEKENKLVRTYGEPPEFDFEPKTHSDLGTELGIFDFERSAKISGARFSLSMGDGATLERALINFMIELQRERGYAEVLPPYLVTAKTLEGTGQLPKFAEDQFHIEKDGLYLIPTAEVPVTNIYAGEILDEKILPLKMVAYTPCFRREAGSYGKDTKGLIRLHQFNKVEIVKLTRPEDSYDELESLTADAEEVLKRLGLSYRVVILCTGDTGFSATKTYDLEVWFPSQKRYREISSCSNYESFQARRGQTRYRPAGGGKTRFVHTLNGSALALGRTIAALIENYQQADGSVVIPEAIRLYMGGQEKIASAK